MQDRILRANGWRLLLGLCLGLAAAGAASVYSWRYVLNPCELDAVDESSGFLIIQLKEYDRVYASAASGTREALTYPITVMQGILVDTQQVPVPACMTDAQAHAIDYMGIAIRALKAFEAGEPPALVSALVRESNRHYAKFYAEVDRVDDCAPFCLP